MAFKDIIQNGTEEERRLLVEELCEKQRTAKKQYYESHIEQCREYMKLRMRETRAIKKAEAIANGTYNGMGRPKKIKPI